MSSPRIRLIIISIVLSSVLFQSTFASASFEQMAVEIDETELFSSSLYLRFPKSNSVTCRQLGMKANDYESCYHNTKILIQAINSGHKVVCDNTYFLAKDNGNITRSIDICGTGCFIFTGAISIKNSISNIQIKGVTIKSFDIFVGRGFDESVATAFIFPKNEKRYNINSIIIRNCDIDNISILRFQNRSGDSIKSVIVDGNTWRNMPYVGIAIGSSSITELQINNNKAYRVKARLFDFGSSTKDIIKKVTVTNNYLSNKGYFSTTSEFYAGFAVIECEDAYCDGNVMEDYLVANPEVNLYDIYCNCRNLTYTNNTKHNVLNFRDVNMLCKAKSFRGENGSRIVENNSFIVDDSIVERYRSKLTSSCAIQMINLAPNETYKQELLSIKNNYISAPLPCAFGMMSNTVVRKAFIQNNTIACQVVANGDYFYRGVIDEAYVSNNKIVPKEKVKTSTPAISLISGKYEMKDCEMSAFPSAISKDVESTVINCVLRFSYFDRSSTHLAFGGMIKDCTLDFQGYDLGDNYNIYFGKSKNPLQISRLKIRNAPIKGTLWFRYLLDAEKSADYLSFCIENDKQSIFFLIDNVRHILYSAKERFSISDKKHFLENKTMNPLLRQITFYDDRLGIEGLDNEMYISIIAISKARFERIKKGL